MLDTGRECGANAEPFQLAPIMPDHRRALCPVRRGVIITGIRPYARYQLCHAWSRYSRTRVITARWLITTGRRGSLPGPYALECSLKDHIIGMRIEKELQNCWAPPAAGRASTVPAPGERSALAACCRRQHMRARSQAATACVCWPMMARCRAVVPTGLVLAS